jgi:hypothetical protein
LPTEDAFALLKRTIEHTRDYLDGCDVTIIMWLRRQDRWLMSMYNQAIKSSLYSHSFSRFADENIGADFFQIVSLWIDAFGRDNVICKSYEDASGKAVDAVHEFFSNICPDVPRSDLKSRKSAHNISLSGDALWLKRRINRLQKQSAPKSNLTNSKKINEFLLEFTRVSLPDRKYTLPSQERRALMDRFRDNNEKLVRELGYTELVPITNLADLECSEEPTPTVGPNKLTPALLSVDQLIKTFFLQEEDAATRRASVVRSQDRA